MMNRPGFNYEWGDNFAHKGIYDRKGRHFVMPRDFEEHLIENDCGYCLTSFYNMSLPELTERLSQWRNKTGP